MQSVLNLSPMIITALHLPMLGTDHSFIPMSWLEDFVLQNMSVFHEGGIPAVILQEETLTTSLAKTESIAILSALGRVARQEFPHMQLGIIFQAHDPFAPLAVAHACGASFVRIKVFVGAMLKAEGVQQGCGIAARDYRHSLGREDIQILADVHDRMGYPVGDVPIEAASLWAAQAGADGIILTGSSFEDSLGLISRVRQSGVDRPLLLGGGVDENNIAKALNAADGVIVSTALKRDRVSPGELIHWDREKILRFMDSASRNMPKPA